MLEAHLECKRGDTVVSAPAPLARALSDFTQGVSNVSPRGSTLASSLSDSAPTQTQTPWTPLPPCPSTWRHPGLLMALWGFVLASPPSGGTSGSSASDQCLLSGNFLLIHLVLSSLAHPLPSPRGRSLERLVNPALPSTAEHIHSSWRLEPKPNVLPARQGWPGRHLSSPAQACREAPPP